MVSVSTTPLTFLDSNISPWAISTAHNAPQATALLTLVGFQHFSMDAALTQLQLLYSTLGLPQPHGHLPHHTLVLSPHDIAAISYG